MTVTVQNARDVSPGNGSATAFPTSFRFFEAADLVVTLVNTTTNVETLQT
jgi:hypothetical protein